MFNDLFQALLLVAVIITGLIGLLALVVKVEQRVMAPQPAANRLSRRQSQPVAL
ncbi:MAG: hypothetical protein WCF04_12460 [Candidatus Nanopelagicales bacterium]